ncbi:MAG: polymorphic toxin-type HINT domain-containing protein [Prevotella sp.]|nr:polymorphic toxin-type HINT domain-containing protein [Prevotella sp.]
MSQNRINQTELKYSCKELEASINLHTGEYSLNYPLLSIGANHYQIATNLSYCSHPIEAIPIGLGNGWKLNIDQYVGPYQTSYALAGYQLGDYIYVDSHWQIHRFILYKEETVYQALHRIYYDESGSGLRLTIYEDNTAQIEDQNRNSLRFYPSGRLSEIISGVNRDITKKIEYEENQIVAIYDTRKSHRKIKFIYEVGRLSKITNTIDDINLSLTYDEQQNIVAIHKGKTSTKEMMQFQYDVSNHLQYIISGESKEALRLLYQNKSNHFRVKSVEQGVVRTIYTTEPEESEVACGEHTYLGDGDFLTHTGERILSYHYEMPSSYIVHTSLFTYLNGATIVKNEKQIETIYYFNPYGFTIGILEKVADDAYKTLFKTGGWSLCTGIYPLRSATINQKNATLLTRDQDKNRYTYQVDSASLAYFTSRFFDSDSMYYYVKDFTLSFWIRFSEPINRNYKMGVIVENKEASFESCEVWLQQTQANNWQYVTIPLHLGFDKTNISNIVFNIYQLSGMVEVEIADMRIAVADPTQIYIDNQAWTKTTCILYEQNGISYEETIDNNFFMNEQDIMLTYQNIFHSQQEEKPTFDLVYCSGTKVKEVSSVKMKKEGKMYALSIQNDGTPNYYIRSVHQTADKRYNVTESQTKFGYDSTNKHYNIENHTSVGYTQKETDRLSQSNASSIYTIYNEQGMLLKEKDAYQVVTENHYDAYGNLESTCIYNETEENGEQLTTEYGYGSISERFRERPLSYTENGITKYYAYHEPYMHLHTNTIEDGTTKWSYDDYCEKVTELEYKDTSSGRTITKQHIQYDSYGRIKSIKDQTGQTYGFFYHLSGEPFKYFENKKLILEKKINRNQNITIHHSNMNETLDHADVITDCVYQSDALDSANPTTTMIDKYGRIRKQENDNQAILYQYQDQHDSFGESKSVAKIESIYDPYEQQTYLYHYDDENRPCGYEVKKDANTSTKQFQVMQTALGDTQYYFSGDQTYIKSKIILEDQETSVGKQKQYINPRTYRTQYVQVESEQSDKEENPYEAFNYTYEYDALGRLHTVCHHRYYGNEIFNQTMGTLKDSKRYYKPNTHFIEKIEHNMVYNLHSSYPTINRMTEATLTENIAYDDKGNITQTYESGNRLNHTDLKEIINESGQKIYSICEQVKMDDYQKRYQYNAMNQLTDESNSKLGKYEYIYDQQTNQLIAVKKNQTEIKRFTYDKGRKTKVYLEGVEKPILYDHYGNIIQDHQGRLTYNTRNQLASYHTEIIEGNWCYRYHNHYAYNYQGVRYKKQFTHTSSYGSETENIEKELTTYYEVDGSRILGEEWVNASGIVTTRFRYFYDIEGITGLSYNGKNYNYLKDVLGNITKITYEDRILAEYIYDAWGNCQLNRIDIENEDEEFVVRYNPFRWKSRYCDVETGNYYVGGRYYSPVLMQYLKAEDIENMLQQATTLNSLDRYAITYSNPLVYACEPTTIYTDQILYPDPNYQPLKHKSWWELHWRKVIQWTLFTIVLITSVVLMCTPAHSFGVGMFVAGMKAAASGALIGGIVGGIISALQGNSFMEGLVNGIVDGFINGFTTGALFFCMSEVIQAYTNTVNSCGTPGTKCFKEGTLILTAEGSKPIEDIQVGDEVWAYDEETGEKALKKVVQLFRNTTKQWTQVEIETEEGIETITCTPGHKFYLPENKKKRDIGEQQEHESYYQLSEKWVRAIDLKIKDKVLLKNGKYGIIKRVTLQKLETAEVTYNFEVEDYHTYYVGEEGTLVHNMKGLSCGKKQIARGIGGKGYENDAMWKENIKIVKKGGTIMELKGGIPTQTQAEKLIRQAGGKILRIEGAHLSGISSHTYPHINYFINNTGHNALRIIEVIVPFP